MKFTKKRVREIIKEEVQNLHDEKTSPSVNTIYDLVANLKDRYAEEEPEDWMKEKIDIIHALLTACEESSREEERVRVK